MNLTVVQCVDVWRGAKSAKVDKVFGFGAGKEFSKTDAERIIHQLIINDFLSEHAEKNQHSGFISSYIRVGYLRLTRDER